MTAEDVRDRWMSKLTAEPDAACGQGTASEHLVRHLLAKTTIPILHPRKGKRGLHWLHYAEQVKEG